SARIAPGKLGRRVLVVMIMDRSSVVVLEIDIENIAGGAVLEAEGQPVVAADRHRKGSGTLAFEFRKTPHGVQVGHSGCALDRVENQAHAAVEFRPDTAGPASKEEPFHTLVRERLDGHGGW